MAVPRFRSAAVGLRHLLLAALLGWVAASAYPSATAAAPTPAPAIDGLSARPVDDAGRPTGEAYVEELRDPGETVQRRLAIANAGSRAIRVWIDAVDATTGSRAGTAFAHRDARVRSTGTWVTPSEGILRLAPGDRKIVAITVHIPPDARPGDHLAGIALQPLGAEVSGGQLAVKQVLRVVIGVHVRVRGATSRSLVPKVLRLERVSGSKVPALIVRLVSRGERLCKPVLTVALSQRGRLVSTERRQLETVLPQTRIDFPVYWPRGLAAGRYDASVRTTGCGAAEQHERAVTLSGDAKPAGGATATAFINGATEGDDGVPPWALGASGLLLAALLLVGLRWRTVRRRA